MVNMIQIECTSKCNYNCRHCYADAKTNTDTYISIEKIKPFIAELSTIGIKKLAVSGGEPLLYPYLLELLECVKAANIDVTLDTNGSLLTQEKVGIFKDLKIDRVNVSLHGYYSETHDWLTRRPGSYYEAINALELLAEIGVPSGISTTINRRNLDEIHKIVYVALILNVEKLSLFRFLQIGRGQDNIAELEITPSDHRMVFERIGILANEIGCNLNYSSEAPYVFWEKEHNFSPCKAGREVCVVLANGNVIPCTGLRSSDFICGNIHSDSLDSIWNNSPVLIKLRKFHESQSEIVGACQNCEFLSECRGGCRAFAFASTGKVKESDPSCWLCMQ